MMLGLADCAQNSCNGQCEIPPSVMVQVKIATRQQHLKKAAVPLILRCLIDLSVCPLGAAKVSSKSLPIRMQCSILQMLFGSPDCSTQHLHAVGREDLVDLLLGVSLTDALLLSNDLGELISVARGALEILWCKLWVLGPESGSCFVETHVICKVVYVTVGRCQWCFDTGNKDLLLLYMVRSNKFVCLKEDKIQERSSYILYREPAPSANASHLAMWNECFCSHQCPSSFCPTINRARE